MTRNETEWNGFIAALIPAININSNRPVSLTDADLDLWWGLLEPYSLEAVKRGLRSSVRQTEFVIKPKNVIKAIEQNDGRPEAEEAWSIVVKLSDESESGRWTDEMSAAWGMAQPLMAMGDEVAARMAFKQHYERRLNSARESAVKVNWSITLGSDKDGRKVVIEDAISDGIISHEQSKNYLVEDMTDEGKEIIGLLGYSGSVVDQSVLDSKRKSKNRQRLQKVMQDLEHSSEIAEKARQELIEKERAAHEARRAHLIKQSQGEL